MNRLVRRITMAVLLTTAFSVVPVYAKDNSNGGIGTIGVQNVITEKGGLHVKVSFQSDQKELAYIPKFTLKLLSYEGNKVLATAVGNSNNFDTSTSSYNLVFDIPEYKSGDKFKLALDKSDAVVSGINYTDYQIDGGKSNNNEYTVTDKQYATITISQDKYTLDDKAIDDPSAKVVETILGKEDEPILASLKTDASIAGIILQDENGEKLDNIPVKIKGTYTKNEIDSVSDSNGMIWVERSKIFPAFTVTPNKNGNKVIGNEAGIYQGSFPLLALGKNPSSFTSFKVLVKNTGLGSIENGGVSVNMSTNYNTDLSKNWTDVELSLTDKNGVTQNAFANMKNNKIALADGTYKVGVVKSDYAVVSLGTNSIQVKDGKAAINMSLKPKYTLEVYKKNQSYRFSVINITSVKDKVYSGSKATVFAVAPGESYMVQDKESNQVINVSILDKNKVTTVLLGVGVLYGGINSFIPQTGDVLPYLIIILCVLLVSILKLMKNMKLLKNEIVNTNKNSIISLFLIGALISSIITVIKPFDVQASGKGYLSALPNNGSPLQKGSLAAQDGVTTGGGSYDQIPGVLAVGFVPVTDYNKLTEDANLNDLSSGLKFQFVDSMLYIAPTQRASEIWNNSGYLTFYAQSLFKIFGTSPLIPDDQSPVDTAGRAARTIPCDSNSSNYFASIISSAVTGKTLNTDSVAVGNSLDNLIKGKFYKGGKASQEARDKFFNSYVELLKTAGAASSTIDELTTLYSQDKVSLVTYSLMGFHIKDSAPNDYKKYCYISVRDVLSACAFIQDKPIDLSDSEWGIYNKLNKYDDGSAKSITFGRLPAVKKYTTKFMTELYPTSSKVTTGQPTNPYGSWAFWHWKNDGSTNLADNPKLSVDLDVSVVNDNNISTGEHFVQSVEGWSDKDNKYFKDMVDDLSKTIVSSSMTLKHDNKTYSILPNANTPVNLFDVADKENLNKEPLSKNGKVSDIKIKAPSINDSTELNFVINSDTLPLAKNLHEYLGGSALNGDESTSWDNSDYYDWYTDSIGESNTSVKQENKYEGKKTADGKTMSSNAKAMIYVKVKDVTSKNLDAESYVVPEWRLSKYWPEISNKVQNSATFSMALTADDPGAPSSLVPSGLAIFGLSKPVLSGADWAKSTPHFINTLGVANITHGNTQAQFKVGGDLLATRLAKDSGINFASWLTNIPMMDGIGSAPMGILSNVNSTMNKSFTFKYAIINALNYIHNIGKVGTRQVQTGIDDAGNPTSDTEDYYYTVPETPVKNYASADYNKTVLFNRYTPKANSAVTINGKSGSENGYYWESKQDSSILKVDPEVLMAFDDIRGNTSVGYVAGDRLREIKPTSYSYVKYNTSIKSNVVGNSVTDSNAKRLAQTLKAGNASVLLKGSAVNISYEIDGNVEAKSFALDIAGASKNNWNPGTSYDSQKVNDNFISKFATKDDKGNWTASLTKEGKLKINGVEYSSHSAQDSITGSTKTIQHHLIIKGGRLISVDGIAASNLTGDIKDAVESMGLLNDKGILGVFEKNTGAALDEQNVADLFNAVRGTSDASVGKGWYEEDTSMVIINEFVTVFNLPKAMTFADKIPMSVPGIEAPVNKAQFFQSYKDNRGTHAGGYAGYTVLRLSLPTASFKYDGTGSEIKYIVGNPSVLDSTN